MNIYLEYNGIAVGVNADEESFHPEVLETIARVAIESLVQSYISMSHAALGLQVAVVENQKLVMEAAKKKKKQKKASELTHHEAMQKDFLQLGEDD